MNNYPLAIERDNWEKHGERPSFLDYGAKGDVKFFTASATSGSPNLTSIFAAGTGTITAVGIIITGVGTSFLKQLSVGLWIQSGGLYAQVATIQSATQLTIRGVFNGTITAAAFTYGVGFNSATDIGKRVIVFGAGNSGARVCHMNSSVLSLSSTDTLTAVQSIDTFGIGTMIGFAGNCAIAGVTWQVFGSNASNFSGETSVHGPVALVALATSDSYVETPPTFRYYRIKIQSTSTGVPGLFFGTIVVLGHVLGAAITSVISPVLCGLSINAGNTISIAQAYFGTDDTAAIQAALNAITSFVPPNTADGGMVIQAPRGKYLVSQPITHPYCVVVQGHHGGGSVIVADAGAFPINTPVWNMTGLLNTDNRIAFFTRLEDCRIDCQHVPGSVGVFCDALQENSGLYRTTVIQWLKTGIQAGSNTDQFGCSSWMIKDPWVYPSNAAFLDDTVAALLIDFAPDTTLIHGTFLGQAGFVCGYGSGIKISNGNLTAHGTVHIESARNGVDFNMGSSGLLSGLTTQSFVLNAVSISGGLPVTLSDINSSGQNAIIDSIAAYITTAQAVPFYISSPLTLPAVIGNTLQFGNSNASDPNIITIGGPNFGGDGQGGLIAVNSMPVGFPYYKKSSGAASNNAMFMMPSATGLDVRVGNANQPIFVAQGICNVAGTAVSRVSGTNFDVTWPSGTQIVLAGGTVAIIASVASINALTLMGSAGTLTGVFYGVSTDINNYGGISPGKSWFSAYQGIGIKTPRIYFDEATFQLGWGNNLDVNQAEWTHGGAAQAFIKLKRSTNSGGTFTDFTIWDVADNVFSVNASTYLGPLSLTAGITGTLLVIDATPTSGVTNAIFSGGAGQGSSAIIGVRSFSGVDTIKLFPDGGSDMLRLGVGAAHPTTNGWAEISNFLGIGGGTQTGAEFLHNFGASLLDATVTLSYVVAHRPLKVDAAHGVISGLIDITSANDIAATTGVATNDVLSWTGTIVAGITGLVSGVVTELVSPAFFTAITSVTLSGTVPPGLTLTTTSENTAIKASAVNNHIVDRGVVTT